MLIPVPADEAERLSELQELALVEAGREAAYDDLVALVARWCEVPMAAVTLIDAHTQWLKARVGLDIDRTPREVSFCTHTILNPHGLMIVPDALNDPRFVDNALVVGPPHLRFYAGAPLVTDGGVTLGALCVLDTRPRELSELQEQSLAVIARQVCALIELHRKHRQLDQQRGFLRTVIDALHEGLIIRDAEARLSLVNQSACSLLGEPLDRHLGERVHGDTPRVLRLSGEALPQDEWPDERTLRSGLAETGLFCRVQRHDGSERILEVNTRALQRDGRIDGVVMSLRDATAMKQLESQLLAEARVDPLTGLPNRKSFSQQLAQALLRARRHGSAVAVGFLDVDGFKQINDQHGHAVGDLVLKEFAARLRAGVRQTDFVARLSGDEFTLVLEDLHVRSELAIVADKVLATIRRPFEIEGRTLRVTTSMGLALATAEEPAEALLQRADAAMYAAKADGRDRHLIA